jgi:5-methylcytosine-specific restriction enzyme subunit McrC
VIRLVVNEHTRIARSTDLLVEGLERALLPARHYDRLRDFDRRGRFAADRVFEWSDGYARSTQWVGVVQVPGLQVEVLPKVDVLTGTLRADAGEAVHEARRNLLYMLSLSGDVPVRSRDVARLAARRAPLSETLAAIFAGRLGEELLRGPERAYLEHEENLRRFKGKLLVARHALRNAAHRERFLCRFEEFSDDTLMNRVFRAACRVLLEVTRTPATQDRLRHCLLLLDGVSDVPVRDEDFSRIAITRQNERFEDLLRFCRLLLAGRSPTVQAGSTSSFSLLFDMNRVFEQFVAGFLRRYVLPRFPGAAILPHGGRHKRHLMECQGTGVLRLEPDLLVEAADGQRLVMDTKWKLLTASQRGRGGVADADLYQLYAYTRRYGCQRSVLLYPSSPGLVPRDFDVLDAQGEQQERVAVRLVDLHRDLGQESQRLALATELERILSDGLGLQHAAQPISAVSGTAA